MSRTIFSVQVALVAVLYSFTNFAQSYCASTGPGACTNAIVNFTLGDAANGVNNSTGCTNGGYADYTATHIAYHLPGGTYQGSVLCNQDGYIFGQLGIWIDFNDNGLFTDAGEQIIMTSSYTGGGASAIPFTVNIPQGAANAVLRMRVKSANSNTGTIPPCGSDANSETEDYTIQITSTPPVPTSYCNASGGCDGYNPDNSDGRHIDNVTYGTVNNNTACGNGSYTNYTNLSSDVSSQGTINISVGTSASNPADGLTCFVDWNNDFDFNDVNESITLSGNAGLFTGALTPPNGTSVGAKRLRVAMYWTGNGTYNGCGARAIGEVEDYTLTVVAPSDPNCATNHSPTDASTSVCPSVQMSWDPDGLGQAASGYKVYLGTSTNPPLVSNQTGTTYTPGTLLPNTQYYWKVVPFNNVGDATGCVEYTFTTSTLSAAIGPDPALACEGQSLTLNGNPTGGAAGALIHTWSGAAVANLSSTNTQSSNFTASTAGTYNVIYTVEDTDGCEASDDISVTVNTSTVVDVSIAITSGTNPSCSGDQIEFTATPTNGGTAPVYDWRVNGISTGSSGAVFTTSTLTNNDDVDVLMASSETCPDDPNKQSNTITMNVNSALVPVVSIAVTDGANPTCPGANVEYTATPTNGGANPTYDWRVNGASVATGAVFSSSTLANNDVLDCIMTSSSGCASPSTANSSSETILHSTPVTPTASITIDNSPNCEGTMVDFSVVATHEGQNPSYEWFVNGVSSGIGSTFSSGSLVNGDVITCELTSDESCVSAATVTSNAITMAFDAPVAPDVTISVLQGNNPGCAGELLELEATAINGGANPSFEWQLNGATAATTQTYSSSAFNDGDQVICILTSDHNCVSQTTATSAPTTVNIVADIIPTVEVDFQQGSNTICEGEEVIFEPVSTNQGLTPTYEWFVNNVSVATTPVYTTSTLVDQDEVYVTLTSSSTCASNPMAISDLEIINVNAIPAIPVVTFDGIDLLTSSATAGNQWMMNGNDLVGETNQTYTITQDGVYTVRVIENGCDSPESDPMEIIGLGLTGLSIDEVIISPNPSTGIFHVNINDLKVVHAKLFSLSGSQVMSIELTKNQNILDLQRMENGVYLLTLVTDSSQKTFRLVKH